MMHFKYSHTAIQVKHTDTKLNNMKCGITMTVRGEYC